MPAHVTKVPCHSISGLRQSYNYMCSRTYYLLIGALSLPFRFAEAERYDIIFPLHYKHEWTLSYTYRVLISPIDKSLEQRNDKRKQNTKISCCEQWLRATPRRSTTMLRHTRGLTSLPLGHTVAWTCHVVAWVPTPRCKTLETTQNC